MRPPHTPPNNEAELDERWLKIWAELRKNAPPSREGTPTERDRALQAPTQPQGPGSVLAGLFQSLGFKQEGGCGCAALQAKMNAWGVEGCREHHDEILDFLETKAKAQGIPFARLVAKVALGTALLTTNGGGS
jgi:hypothetical protein